MPELIATLLPLITRPAPFVADIVPAALVTVLPAASTTLTTGCVPSATAFWTVVEGAVLKASAAGAPKVCVNADVTDRVPSLKVRV